MRFGYERRFILLLVWRLGCRVVGWLLMTGCGWLDFLTVCGFIMFWSQLSGDFTVEGGEFGFELLQLVLLAPFARHDGFKGRHIDTLFLGTFTVLTDCVGEFFKGVYEVHAGGMGV